MLGLAFLVGLARWLHARDVFEIGTYNGITAACLASNLDDATVRTLDLPPATVPRLPTDVGDSLHIGTGVVQPSSAEGRVEFLHGDSATFDFEPFAGSCDLVYVDGAHSYEYVRSDSEHAFAMLRSRAAIVWDDYRRGMEGVVRALDEVARDAPLHRVPRTRLVVHFTAAAREELDAVGD